MAGVAPGATVAARAGAGSRRPGVRRQLYAGKVHNIAVCGSGQLRIMGDTELIVIEPASGQELWRRPALALPR